LSKRIRNSLAFGGWLATARAGARCVYYTGSLAQHRDGNPALDAYASHVGLAAESGLIELSQYRSGGHFDYVATRTSRRYQYA
jgi:hypothetical protein